MVDPISLTVASMQNDMQRMNVLANNAANALTPGFKREMLALSGQLGVTGNIPGVASSLSVTSLPTVVTDLSPGTPKKTSNPLDIALLGEGYLEVRTDQGLAYTRLGTLRVDEQGRLVTQAGYAVSGVSGDIVLSTPTPVIEKDGQIFEKGKQVGQLKIVTFDRPSQLLNIGNGLLMQQDGITATEVARPRVAQGQLESSNVDSAREMVSLVQTFRHFEASNRLLQAYDDVRDKTFRNLGQF